MPPVRVKIVAVGSFCLILVLLGCATLFRPETETVSGYTNIVVSVLPDGNFQTNVISQPTIVITNWVKGETFNTIDAVGGVIPIYGEVAVALIGLAGTICLGWLNKENKKHKKVAVSTIQPIAQFRAALKASGEKGVKLDDSLTAMLETSHLHAGVKDVVDEMIKVHTNKTVKPEASEEVKKLL